MSLDQWSHVVALLFIQLYNSPETANATASTTTAANNNNNNATSTTSSDTITAGIVTVNRRVLKQTLS